MADNERIDIPLGVQDSTGPALQGFQELGKVTKQIRDDIKAVVDGTQDISDRAEKMRSFWKDNVEYVNEMKNVLEIIQTTIQTNQTSLSNNLTQINEILSSVRGLGGNVGQAMQMIGMAGGGFGGGQYGNVGQYIGNINGSTAAQDFSSLATSSSISVARQAAATGREMTESQDFEKTAVSAGRSPRLIGGTTSSSGIDVNNIPLGGNSIASSIGITQSGIQSQQQQLQDDLATYKYLQKYNIVPLGQEARAAELAYRYSTNVLKNTFGNGPLANAMSDRVQQYMSGGGVTLDSIRRSQRATTTQAIDPVTGEPMTTTNANGDVIPVMTRTSGIPEGPETTSLTIANNIARVLDSGISKGIASIAGRITQVSAVYGATQDVMNKVRGVSGFVQAQGSQFGEVDYGRAAGMYLQSQLMGGFGFNPNYSSQQAYQNMIYGAGIGLRGATNINAYTEQALKAQQYYGLNGQQYQQLVAQGLGVGITSQQQYNALSKVAGIENNTQTSTAYGMQALVAAESTSAGMGLSGAAASQVGVGGVQFGAGNFVAQAAGFTGQEGVGSQMMNALMAQQMGTSYTNLYSKISSSSSAAYNKAVNASQEEILGWAGINTSAHYKDEKDFKRKNSQNIVVLQMILQGLGDPGHAKAGATLQSTETWAWSIVKQHQNFRKPKKPGSVIAGILGGLEHIAHDVGNTAYRGVTDAANIVPGAIGHVLHGVVDTATDVGGIVSGQSWNSIHNWQRTANSAIDNNWSNPGQAVLKNLNNLVHGAANTVQNGLVEPIGNMFGSNNNGSRSSAMGTTTSHKIEVYVHPNSRHLINAAVKAGTAGNNNGNTPPNNQPTNTSWT